MRKLELKEELQKGNTGHKAPSTQAYEPKAALNTLSNGYCNHLQPLRITIIVAGKNPGMLYTKNLPEDHGDYDAWNFLFYRTSGAASARPSATNAFPQRLDDENHSCWRLTLIEWK